MRIDHVATPQHVHTHSCQHVSIGGLDNLQAFFLAAQAVSKVSVSRGEVFLQGSQPALGQKPQHSKLQSVGPSLAQHVTDVQLSARLAMLCLMHQLTALLTNKHAAAGGHHHDQAQHKTAAGSKTVCFLAQFSKDCYHYTAAL